MSACGFDNGTVFFPNGMDPRGVSPVVNQMSVNGRIPIGSAASPYVVCNTLTPGSGISITNGAGSITISATTGGLSWIDAINASYTLAIQTGYVTDRGGGVTYTLPATANLGDKIKIVGFTGLWTVAQNANQSIGLGSSTTSVGVGGSLAATDAGDCIELVCIVSGTNTKWRVTSVVGNITVT